jgi:hypothetical protein
VKNQNKEFPWFCQIVEVETRGIQFSTERLTGRNNGAIKRFDPRGGSPARYSLTRAKTLSWSYGDGTTVTSIDRGLGRDT